MSLPGQATPGNVIVSSMGADKDTGTPPTPTEPGWELIGSDNSDSVSVAMAYRIATGDANDTCTWAWGDSVFSSGGFIGEYAASPGSFQAPIVATNFTDESDVVSVPLGPVTADGDGFAVACVGVDTGSGWGWDGGFTERADFAAGGNSGFSFADLLGVTDAQSVSAEPTDEGETADQQSGLLAVFGWVPDAAPAQLAVRPSPVPQIRVTTHDRRGGGHDITDRISGLTWSSVQPGGDEQAGFTFHASWHNELAEIARGRILRISEGLRCLWQGRIQEHDRGGDQNEEVAVTAYGMGILLKDDQLREIYLDRDLTKWIDASTDRRLGVGASYRWEGSVSANHVDGIDQGIVIEFNQYEGGIFEIGEAWYWAIAPVGSLHYSFVSPFAPGTHSSWITRAIMYGPGGEQNGVDHERATVNNQVLTANAERRQIYLQVTYTGPETDPVRRPMQWKHLLVTGAHGLPLRGSWPNEGLYDSDIVTDVISRIEGLQPRTIEPGDYVIQQCVADGPPEDTITEVARWEDRVWGTWGPESTLDTTLDGYFDFRHVDRNTRHWTVRRDQCEGLPQLRSEMSTLFDQVDVHYTDVTGQAHVVRRTRPVPALIEAGMSPRTYRLDGGRMTAGGAATLGDAFLVLSGGFAPARGRVTITGPLRHHQLGEPYPHRLRADGSNLAIQDILPTTTMLTLDDTADRRTTFPIRRVRIDASGPLPQATVELDQAADLISQAQARLEQAATSVLG